MKRKINSLYIHIPFCNHICHYCDFTKLFYNENLIEPYLEALFAEIDSYNIKNIKTIYIGGGTPTSLSEQHLKRLLEKVKPLLASEYEFTVEGNVENITSSKLKIMKESGVNRLSIGIQTTNNELLNKIGRNHTFEQTIKVIRDARKLKFNNINVDLIYGLPGQNQEQLANDINNILGLNTEHISIYSLTVSPGTIFFNKKVKEQKEDDARDSYDFILKTLRQNGYKRYEISNFAKPGFESEHNQTYWKDEQYYAVGLGASGYIGDCRYTNTKNINKYIKQNYIEVKETIIEKDELEDFMLCNLRLEDGFLDSEFVARFHVSFYEKYKEKCDKLINDGLLIIDNGRIRLSDSGLIIMDRILIELI